MEKKRKREPWLFLLPVLVVLLLLFGYPLINSIVMAFQNYKLTAPNDIYFNGFENFKKLFGDPDGLMILKNSIIYVVISVAGQFLLGLTLALALKKQFKGRGLYQSIVFLPWAFSGFVVGLIFRWSFNGEYGVVNNLLMKLGIIDNNIAWLGTPGYSLAVVIIAMDGDSVLCDHDTCRTAIHSGRCIRGGGCGRMWNGTSIFPDHASLYQTDIDHNGAFADDLDL